MKFVKDKYQSYFNTLSWYIGDDVDYITLTQTGTILISHIGSLASITLTVQDQDSSMRPISKTSV